ncbi:MAG: hypothetical protein ACI4G0_05940 [Ruminococcus sp.]
MKIDNKKAGIILSVIIILSLAISTFYMATKQGFHEDELLTYNLANSSKQLNVDGGWNSYDDFNEYLTVSENDRFDYAQVYENQIIDASHPPFYYALVHTVCSLFPNVFSKWLAYSINVLAMVGILILLFKIGKKVTGNNLYALIASGAYALSIACITTTIYLRMYATLTFFVLAFLYMSLVMYEKKNTVRLSDCLMLTLIVILGILTQYYFILFAGLIGLVFLVFKIKERNIKDLIKYIIAAIIGAVIALCIYPYIISNVLGGNRGLGSLNISNLEFVTIFTYLVYKLCTYIQILAKDLFLNQVWLFALCAGFAIGAGIYFRFTKKHKLNRKAMFIIIPALVYFIGISLVSPFNSDRYVMASLPLISMLFTFAFIKIFELIKNEKARLVLPAGIVLASAIAFGTVTPYYIYGRTNLYETKTDNCVFVGTAMLEWNKCIDKFMNYDSTMIVQTSQMSKTLGDELESFATDRGVVTKGKISELAKAYMFNGDTGKVTKDSMSALKTDKKLSELSEVTVYVSRLADNDSTIKYITDNTDFKNYELIQADYSFDDFYNWYDYFVETESYCNVYRFYK